jgi:large subunit ribosomal protein L7/L12
MMKNVLILAGLMVVTLAACDKKEETATPAPDAQSTEAPAAATSAAAPAAAPATSAAAPAEEEKTEFNVILKDVGADKIKVIKVVREITGLGLKEAKDLVDGAPKTVKENASKEEAASIEAKFKEVGATVEIK